MTETDNIPTGPKGSTEKVRCDAVLEITGTYGEGTPIWIRSGFKPEVIQEVLSTWLQDQAMTGRDGSPMHTGNVYRIKIGWVAENDSFPWEANVGNRALAVGIVGYVLGEYERVVVLPWKPTATPALLADDTSEAPDVTKAGPDDAPAASDASTDTTEE